MNKEQAILFLEKLIIDEYSEAEYSSFQDYLKQCSVGEYSEIVDKWQEVNESYEAKNTLLKRNNNKLSLKTFSIAAAVIAIVSIGVFLFLNNSLSTFDTKNIKPGSNNAVLTLEDGTEILLKDVDSGQIAEVNGIRIVKAADGKLVYETKASKIDDKVSFNKISTPRGGQYQIKLPDGTDVWLNAASSIRYPTRFVGKERSVELEGEGYFEVAKNPDMPFKVKSKKQEITVLGTHFNVNSYDDTGEVLTTVAEGKVRVEPLTDRQQKSFVILEADQQSSLNIKNNKLKVSDVQASLSIAWKGGKFQFQDTPIAEVLQQFSRWYNIDFEYVGKDMNITLWGDVNRNVSASEALEILKFFELKYSLIQDGEHKKIIVTK